MPLHDDVLPAPPDGFNYTSVISQSLTLILLIAMFASFCIPMLVALFFFSSQHSCRRSPVFYVNAAALVLGIVEGIYCVAVVTHDMLNPLHQLPQAYLIFYYAIAFYTPVFVECILIFRLNAVYPAQVYTRKKRIYIIGFPILLKVVRCVNNVLIVVYWVRANHRSNLPISSGIMGYSHFVFPKIGWGLQMLDNGFCSIAFLLRLRSTMNFSRRRGPFRDSVLRKRLQRIFILAVSNFVAPGVLSLIHLVLAIMHDRWNDVRWFYNCSYLMVINNYITITSVVFATIWATSVEWASTRGLCGCDDISSTSATAASGSSRRYSSGHLVFTPTSATSDTSTKISSPRTPDHYLGFHPDVFKKDESPHVHNNRDSAATTQPLRVHISRETMQERFEIITPDLERDVADEEQGDKKSQALVPGGH